MRSPIDSGTVLITGASSGMGREIARQLSRRARTLVLVARDAGRLEVLREELLELNPTLGVMAEQCDLAQPEAVDALLDSLRRNLVRVDVLVNNAEVGDYGLFEQESWSRIHEMIQANMTAPLLLTHRLVRHMVESKRGGILNIGSCGGRSFVPGLAVHAATQRFLDGFTEALRLEVLSAGVGVTQVAPGPLEPENDEAPEGPLAAWLRISAARCASEAIAGFDRGEPLVHPGRAHRWLMRLAALMPRRTRRAVWLPSARRLRYGTSLLEPAHPDGAPGLLLAGGTGGVRNEM
jgi:uncharacterized protein